MRRSVRLAALLSLIALAQAPAFSAQAAEDQFSRISPAKMVNLIQEAGFRAELIKGDDPAQARIVTGINGYNVNIRFLGCNKADCSDVQYYLLFDKEKRFNLDFCNKWNGKYGYLRALINGEGQLFLGMEVDLDGGVSASYMKQRLRLIETMLGSFKKFLTA